MAEDRKRGIFLFPHISISESQARGLCELRGRVFLCLPWFFEPPTFLEEMRIEILRPDPASMPSAEFPNILEHYLKWMEENEGLDHSSYLASRWLSDEDFSIESLKAMIRHGEAGSLPDDSGRCFYRHLILHLYGRSEEAMRDAGKRMAQLDKMPSPVAVLLEEPAEWTSAFMGHDSPFSEAYPSGVRAVEILESWIALFSELVEPGADLATMDEWVAEALLSVCGCELKPETSDDGRISYLSFPERKCGTNNSKSRLVNWISGKNLVLLYSRQ